LALKFILNPPVGSHLLLRRGKNRKGKLKMALAEFNLRQLLEAGVHFGHQKKRWNPKMEPFIYGARNGIHILDLTQTVPLLDAALQVVTQTVAKGGIILFVGTKRQAQKAISEAAEKSAQYYMNHRWLGGTLTNWKTVSNSISRLKKIDEQLEGNTDGLTKKERLNIEREQGKLQASLGGIRDMGGTPDLVFVIDTNKESLAIKEAQKLGIPVVAIIDTNSNPDGIDFPIPGNDDAARSVALYCDLIARAALDGMESQLGAAGVDVGEKIELAVDDVANVAVAVDNSDDSNDSKKMISNNTKSDDMKPDDIKVADRSTNVE
jgi:small subunit ribosomal protein S2